VAGRGRASPFTARVKDELAALRPETATERRALLAALLRFAASLHISGAPGPRYSLVLATGSGPVARLAHWLLTTSGVRPDLRVKERGALAPRALYEVVLTQSVETVLADTAILGPSGRFAPGIPSRLVRARGAAAVFARGALLARGSLSAPTREPHLEIGAPDERVAADLARLLVRLDLPANAVARGGPDGARGWRVVVKGGDAIGRVLIRLGARDAYLAWEDGLIRREVRGEATRLANADQANLRRTVHAAVASTAAIERVLAGLGGWDGLSPELADIARLRVEHPQASLAELGAMLDPPRSKGTVAARLRRIEQLDEAAGPPARPPRD
jgi:DNA-binding protein WhiA